MKQYKAVAAPKNISVSKGDTQAAFNAFADIINREAQQGWTYHSMSTIAVTENQGCMQPAVTVNHYMLIFVRQI